MNTQTQVSTTHRTALAPEEWFTVKLADKVLSVDRITSSQSEKDGKWEIQLHGNRVLKSGAFGKRVVASTWEHSRSFTGAATLLLWRTIPLAIRDHLGDLGVKP